MRFQFKLENVLPAVALIFGVFGGQASVAEDAGHDHHKVSGSPAAIVRPVHKFSTDQALRERMNTVLHSMMELHKEKSKGTERKLVVKKIGSQVEATVQDIFKSCKLEPSADAAIHPILAGILAGASLLKKGSEEKGHEKVHQAFLKYEEFFDHPNWAHKSEEHEGH